MNQALEAEKQTYKGFLVTKYLPLPELQSTLIELVHEKSGARIIHIANQDPENLFCLSFQTLPASSNGVAHILEHTVLCGSEKFPVKDPFFAMTRRSLNTYMNALTGQDFTCYPASSQVKSDFYNLLSIYLDAVFYPKLTRMSFLQEGHRLGFTVKGDKASPLEIQGVVYNEMKGAMTGADSRLWQHLFEHLLPDLPYSFNSGGDPKEIPNLTHEDLIEFHKTYYHPSRCLFFFYGNLPLSNHLDAITPILNNTVKRPLLPPLPLQPRFASPVFVRKSYPIAEGEKTEKQTIIALSFLTASIAEQTELLALSLIDSILTDTDVSPLKLALIESGLCTLADSSLDLEMSEAPWTLVCKGCDEESGESILHLVLKCLKELSEKGFDPDLVEASLHQLEFHRSEIGSEGAPFGLTLFFRAALSKQHGADPEHALLLHSLFEELRSKLADPAYLPSLIKRHFLENPHFVCLTLTPDPTLESKEKGEETDRINHISSHLSDEERETILREEKELTRHQEEVEHQSLDCLPMISLSEVSPTCKDYPLTISTVGSLTVASHRCFTNRILYADLFFNLPNIASDDLIYLPFWARCMTEVGSKQRGYAEMLQLQQSSVGELTASLVPIITHEAPDLVQPSLALKAKALDRKSAQCLDLFKEISLSADFLDAKRVQELLFEHTTALQSKLPHKAMAYAIQMALASFSRPAALNDFWRGLPYYHAALSWAKNAISLPERLQRIHSSLLCASNPTLVISAAEEEERRLTPYLSSLAAEMPREQVNAWDPNSILVPSPLSQGKIIASPVAFNAFAYNTVSFKNELSVALMVATDLFENVVLHNEVREKGGAYGSGASYVPTTGQLYFYSYRDPHLSRTYHAFLKAIETIAKGKFTPQELIEAKLGILQDLDAPQSPGERARTAYGWLRADRTLVRRDQWRRAILECTKEEIVAAVQTYLLGKEKSAVWVSFAGQELLKREAKLLPFPFEISVV